MKNSIRRLDSKHRREEILNAALDVAEHQGYKRLTRIQVATRAKCAESLISKYFGTMEKFRRTIMRNAVKNERLMIIAQGLVNGDKHAQKASQELRDRALKSLS